VRALAAALLAVAFLGALAPSGGWCAESADPEPFPRTVLVLYNSDTGQTPRENLFCEGFAVIANYLGLTPEYRDVSERPLPSDEDMRGVRGIATVFTSGQMRQPETFLRWLLRQMDQDRKLLVLGGLGAYQDRDGRPVDPALPREVLRRLGLDYQPDFLADQARLRYARVNKTLTGFERPLPAFPPVYEQYRPLNGTTPWIVIKRLDKPAAVSAVVSTSRAGGMAMWEYVSWQDPASFRNQWYLDPFALLSQSMGMGGAPALTPTTASGMRVAISHIDADGFGGFSRVNKTAFCGQVVMDHILSRYDFPITASVIQAEVDPELSGSPALFKLARRLFAMDNVEPASHTYSHPYYWDSGNEAKARLYMEKHGLTQYGIEVPGYTFNSSMEIVESCRWIDQKLAPPDEPCEVVLWSGDCEPTARQVELCEANGLLNMNGGDTLYDAQRDSLFSVAPLYQPVGGAVQVLTGQANDNILTNEWTGPFFGYRFIIETMRRTGTPRRLAPIDVYYHFFSGERHASLQALRDVYEWVMARPTAPLFASRYMRMVQDFVSSRMSRRGDGAWIVEDYGQCASLRLAEDGRVPYLPECEGVQGYYETGHGTFVHLEPEGRAVVVLGETDGGLPHLQWATGIVRDFQAGEHGAALVFDCFGQGRLRLAGMAPGERWEAAGPALDKPLTFTVDDDGGATIGPVGSGPLHLRRR
jgi:hypothetical protein